MADTVRVNTTFSGGRRLQVHLIGISDGTGETKVKKVSLDNLALFNGARPVSLALMSAKFNVDSHASVVLYWQRDPVDIEMLVMKGRGSIDYKRYGGLQDPNRGGTGSGDILLSINTPVSGGTYQIDLEFRLKD